MRWCVAFVALTGCSQLFGLTSPVRDDGGDDDARPDTVVDDGRPNDSVSINSCTQKWLQGPLFGSLTLLGVSSQAEEQAPFVTTDGLELYFEQDADVFRATRSTTTADFTNPNKVGGLSSGSFEGKTFVSADKLRALFASTRPGSGGAYDIFRGTRLSAMNPFSVDQMYLDNINSASNDVDPHLSSDLLHIYYATTINAMQVIALATRATATDNFGNGAELAALTSGSGESGPTLTADELVIVFTSNRATGVGPGASNLWYATRASTSAPFGAPTLVPTVNSNQFDGTPHLTADGCTLYFSSSAAGSYDLYVSTLQ